MEKLDQEKVKETRTEKLLKSLSIPKEGFIDSGLPSGVFSYSQYTAYTICGRAYEYKYVLKQEMPNYAPLVRGVSVHAGIEAMLRAKMEGKTLSLEAAIAVADSRFNEAAETVLDWGLHDDKETENTPESIRTQVHDLMRVFTAEGVKKINPIGIEKGFAKKIGDVPMVGWIDLIDLQPAMDISQMSTAEAIAVPKKRVVVDFKTTSKTWGENQVNRNPQLTLYADVEGTPHVRVDQLVTTKKVKYVRAESERKPQDIEILSEHINEVATLIKKGVFQKCPVDSWCCDPKHCSWWDKCRGRKR